LSRLIKSPVFSCSVGIKKPNSRIYQIAAASLRVEPRACLYVADGDIGELQGAIGVGMGAVRIRAPYEEAGNTLRVSEEDWQGLTISSLRQVLGLVEAFGPNP
jgi:FMN phosphatase YigB (HAD superfamily)